MKIEITPISPLCEKARMSALRRKRGSAGGDARAPRDASPLFALGFGWHIPIYKETAGEKSENGGAGIASDIIH